MNVPVWEGAFHRDLDIAFTRPFRDVGNTRFAAHFDAKLQSNLINTGTTYLLEGIQGVIRIVD